MEDSKTHAIRQRLLDIDAAGQVATSFLVPSRGLCIEVAGAVFPLPLSREDVHRLLVRVKPSPFGFRDETRYDDSVRRSKEIPGAEVLLDPESWTSRLDRGLSRVVRSLGFPSAEAIEASLQKLVIYEPGGFFAPHRDTERDPSMWGTLVVVLPTDHRGGELLVTHAGKTTALSTPEDSRGGNLRFDAFFADCVHEVAPVVEGYRVSLTFSLHAPALSSPTPNQRLDHLGTSLAPFTADDDGWLVILFDHAYTRQKFGWSQLKGRDAARAGAVRHSAANVGGACFLAFADVCETFEYLDEPDDEGDGGCGGGDDEDGLRVQPDATASRDLFGAFQGREVNLEGWIDGEGRPCTGTELEMAEVVSLVDPMERSPYQLHGEPWTGNEGGDAQQWYRGAALVVGPSTGSVYERACAPRPDVKVRSKVRVRRRRRAPQDTE